MIASRLRGGPGRAATVRCPVRSSPGRRPGLLRAVLASGLAAALTAVIAFCGAGAPLPPGEGAPGVLPLRPRPAYAATPGLRLGDSGQDVAWAQLRLTGLGHFRGTATGYFGPVTKAAVESYQRQAGLAVTGVLGPQTARRLCATAWVIRVGKGDTLEAVARRHMVTVAEICRANPGIINPNRIYAGQSIVIPPPSGILRIAGLEASPAAAPASGGTLVPVSSGTGSAQRKAGATGGAEKETPGSGSIVPGTAVLLTFNDGPDPEVLPKILEILRRNGCRAVFFFSGEQMEKHPDLVKTVSAQGHSVQSHGWRHETLSSLAETRITADLDAASRLIATLTGKPPAFFRPPEGAVNEAILMSARRVGQKTVFWQNIGGLPDGTATVNRLDRYLTERTVIMLPGADAATASYLQALLDRWQAAGVRLLQPEDLALMPVVW